MWKKVCCAALVSMSHQVEALRSVKAAFLRGQSGPARGGETFLGGWGEATWREGKEGQVRWERFLDLLTVAEETPFIFGRLLMSGSASAPGCSGTWHALWSVRPGKPCEMSPDWWCSLTQLYFTISPVGLGAVHSLLNLSPFSFHPIKCFFTLIFSLSTSPPAPITSISALPHPSVVFPAYPGLLLFFFWSWQACIHKWFAARWPMLQTLLYQLLE